MLIKLLGHYWTKIFIYLRNYKRTTKTAVILTFKENSLYNSLLPLHKE